MAKVTSAKEESKSLFTGLQKKPTYAYLTISDYYQLVITNRPFNRAPCLKTIKEVGGVKCSSHVDYIKEVQIVSSLLPQQKVEILNVENFP